MILHGYWRSSAAYRVRIGLALKGLAYGQSAHDLRLNEQKADDYLALNPQGLVPALEVDGQVVTQSAAILEWLEETHPEPALLPADAMDRARVRSMSALIASDIHPLNNLRVLKRLREDFALDQTEYPDEISEEALAHIVGSKVRRAYRRGEALERRRRLMNDWADFVSP